MDGEWRSGCLEALRRARLALYVCVCVFVCAEGTEEAAKIFARVFPALYNFGTSYAARTGVQPIILHGLVCSQLCFEESCRRERLPCQYFACT